MSKLKFRAKDIARSYFPEKHGFIWTLTLNVDMGMFDEHESEAKELINYLMSGGLIAIEPVREPEIPKIEEKPLTTERPTDWGSW